MELPLKIHSIAKFTDDMFFDLCQANSQLLLERDKEGNIIIVMTPTGSDTGFYNGLYFQTKKLPPENQFLPAAFFMF